MDAISTPFGITPEMEEQYRRNIGQKANRVVRQPVSVAPTTPKHPASQPMDESGGVSEAGLARVEELQRNSPDRASRQALYDNTIGLVPRGMKALESAVVSASKLTERNIGADKWRQPGDQQVIPRDQQTIPRNIAALPPAAAAPAGSSPSTSRASVQERQPQDATPNIAAALNGKTQGAALSAEASPAAFQSETPGVVTGHAGTLSTYSNPETEGMTDAQKKAYWQNQSDYYDAKLRRRELEAELSANTIQSGDSIGTVLAKRANMPNIRRALEDNDARMNSVMTQQQGFIPQVQGADEKKKAELALQSAGADLASKTLDLNAKAQMATLRAQYQAAKSPEERSAIMQQMRAITGKESPKVQIVTDEGLADDGITKVNQSYAFDPDTGRAFRISDMAATKPTQEQVVQQAQQALATGKISKEEVNKRLVANGYTPIP